MKKYLNVVGIVLVIFGVVLAVAKHFFEVDGIGFWTLAFIVPGMILQWVGSRKGQANG